MRALTMALTAIAASALAVSAANAAIMAQYSFTASSLASSDSDADSTAGDWTVGAGLVMGTGGSPVTYITATAPSTAATEAASITGNDYFSFTITPAGGSQLALESLTFKATTSWGQSTAAAWYVGVYSSVDNFATKIYQAGQTTGVLYNAWLDNTASLSATAFQNLATATEFRFYIWDGASGSTSAVRLDEVILNGTAAIPEPTSLALLASAVLLISRRARA